MLVVVFQMKADLFIWLRRSGQMLEGLLENSGEYAKISYAILASCRNGRPQRQK